MSPMCAPEVARRLRHPDDLVRETLLRSFRTDEWAHWFAAAGARAAPPVPRGPVFDTSLALAAAAATGAGIALLPLPMFEHELRAGRLMRPFTVDVSLGSYWLTRLQSRQVSAAMAKFREWLLPACHATAGAHTAVSANAAQRFRRVPTRRS